jgi:hypothetical protein
VTSVVIVEGEGEEVGEVGMIGAGNNMHDMLLCSVCDMSQIMDG